MTDFNDLELSQRLRALRVDPPANGFEARLADLLLEVAPDPAPRARPAAPARVILGPWLRRGSTRLIGAGALFVAGAAAALDGGVIEWVQTRVFSPTPAEDAAPEATPAKRTRLEPRLPVVRDIAPAAPAREPLTPSEPAASQRSPAPTASLPTIPRLSLERTEPRRSEARAMPERPPLGEALGVPRVAIEPRSRGSRESSEARVEHVRPSLATGAPRERERDLERIRDIARMRRERGAAGDRPRALERVRERFERREVQSERGRRERPIK